MTSIDWLVIAAYLGILCVIVWRSSRHQDNSTDYFLAGRNIGWFAIGASIFASNIGSEHIVGLAGQGATSGMAMAHWEMHAWVALMLGWFFVPFYYNSKVFTMPEFLEKRFNPAARWILSIVSLIAYVFTKVSVTVYAGAVVFNALLPEMQLTVGGFTLNAFWIGALTTVLLTGIYTIFGGMRAVLYTDAAQTIVLLLGAFSITYFGLKLLGGWGELVSFCKSNKEQFQLWRPLSQPAIDGQPAVPWWKNGDFPWLGILMASPIVGIWYWCTDQYIVQRTLAAKNLTAARRGAIWGAFLKIWPVLIFLIPGLIAAALHAKGELAIASDEAGKLVGDQVFPSMVANLLPTGLRGLVVGALMAALMSSLSSLFNSTAALFTVDVYQKLHPRASEKHLVTVGRFATCVVVGLGLLWIPVMPMISEGGLYVYLQSVQGYLAPPITAVFLLGLFNRRVNSQGAVWGLAVGFTLGLGKLSIQALFGEDKIADPILLAAIGDFNFLYFSGLLFLICVLTVLVASHLSAPPDQQRIKGLTFASIDKQELRASYTRGDMIATGICLTLILGFYLYFSFWI